MQFQIRFEVLLDSDGSVFAGVLLSKGAELVMKKAERACKCRERNRCERKEGQVDFKERKELCN